MTIFHGPNKETVQSNGSAAGERFVAAYAEACRASRVAMDAWLQSLRERGVYTASPDDGWVDRAENSWTPPSYANMIGPIGVGTEIVLGTPRAFRIVRVTEVRTSTFGITRYFFDGAAQ